MARPKRFELLTPWFVAKYSIQLSYGRFEGCALYAFFASMADATTHNLAETESAEQPVLMWVSEQFWNPAHLFTHQLAAAWPFFSG